MKIGIISQFPFPFGLAATNRIKAYSKALISQGIDVTVIMPEPRDNYGSVIFYWLFKSSKRIDEIFPATQKYALIVTFVLSAISYRVFSIPVFTSFWLFGVFNNI